MAVPVDDQEASIDAHVFSEPIKQSIVPNLVETFACVQVGSEYREAHASVSLNRLFNKKSSL